MSFDFLYVHEVEKRKEIGIREMGLILVDNKASKAGLLPIEVILPIPD